jgi:hypothetical protein
MRAWSRATSPDSRRGPLCYACPNGGVAQPGRALPSHGRGQGFKSPHLHQTGTAGHLPACSSSSWSPRRSQGGGRAAGRHEQLPARSSRASGECGSGFGLGSFVFQPTEQALPPGWMHLIGDVCLPSAFLLDPMLFLRDLLVHSGVAPGRAEITHWIEVIPRHFAEQVAHGSTQHPDTSASPLIRRNIALSCDSGSYTSSFSPAVRRAR